MDLSEKAIDYLEAHIPELAEVALNRLIGQPLHLVAVCS